MGVCSEVRAYVRRQRKMCIGESVYREGAGVEEDEDEAGAVCWGENTCMNMYIYMYIYVCMYICVYTYIDIRI